MLLTVIIPAFNERESIGGVLALLPSCFPDDVHVSALVIDDGSTDGTADEARSFGAKVITHARRLGLAAAFRTGLQASLQEHADLIATLDADGQYRPQELVYLLKCLRETGADLVVGDRRIRSLTHMPLGNRIGNIVGSAMLRFVAGVPVQDASSGFRLFTERCARSLRIMSQHTYTHEMLIQATALGMKIVDVPVTFLPRLHGRSKLVRTLRQHIARSCGTILKALFSYRPLRKFLSLAGLSLLAAVALLLLAIRHASVEFLVVALILALIALQFLILGLTADSFASQRRLFLEESERRRS